MFCQVGVRFFVFCFFFRRLRFLSSHLLPSHPFLFSTFSIMFFLIFLSSSLQLFSFTFFFLNLFTPFFLFTSLPSPFFLIILFLLSYSISSFSSISPPPPFFTFLFHFFSSFFDLLHLSFSAYLLLFLIFPFPILFILLHSCFSSPPPLPPPCHVSQRGKHWGKSDKFLASCPHATLSISSCKPRRLSFSPRVRILRQVGANVIRLS